ncbi:hypothetical protein D3C81_1718890 [compost metagenome]
MVVLAPTRQRTGATASRPVLKRRSISAMPASSARASGSRARPWPLSTSRRPTRSNSARPNRLSNSLKAALTADCDKPMVSPAAVVVPASAMAEKICSWRKERCIYYP